MEEGQRKSSLCSFVYGSPVAIKREDLCIHLKDIHSTLTKAWVVLGDFNDYASTLEKRGGSYCPSRALKFCNNLHECDLVDLGFNGSPYSYARKLHSCITSLVMLDRVVSNDSWRLMYTEASIYHLPRIHSNHNVTLVKHYGEVPPAKDRPFHFQAAWLQHEEFKKVFKHAWVPWNHSVCDGTYAVGEAAKQFNKEVFDNIFKKKRELGAWFTGIHKNVERHHSDFLNHLEKKLLRELEDLR